MIKSAVVAISRRRPCPSLGLRHDDRASRPGGDAPQPASFPVSRRRIMSTSSAPHLHRLQNQPPKVIRDYLTPMPSHLLTTTLADLAQHAVRDKASSAVPPSSPVIQSPPLPLPQGHHLVYFPIQAAPSRLAPDGADLDHSPGPHYSRRLWAGGEVVFCDPRPLRLNARPWTCIETIGHVQDKPAGGDPADSPAATDKIFVDVWRKYALGHPSEQETPRWSIQERRTLVFMNPAAAVASSKAAPSSKILKYPFKADCAVKMLPSPRHLFHFSALTFNAHAIHLDPEYARSVDGHRAPLVHGPLTLALILRVLTAHTGQLVSRFVYRNHAPLYVNEPFTVKVRQLSARRGGGAGATSWDAWVEGPGAGLAVKGTAIMFD